MHISRPVETPSMCEWEAEDVDHHVPGVCDERSTVRVREPLQIAPEGNSFCSATYAGQTSGEMDHAVEAAATPAEPDKWKLSEGDD